jgi:hypothetical protein
MVLKINYLGIISFPQRLILINYLFRSGSSLRTTVCCSPVGIIPYSVPFHEIKRTYPFPLEDAL